MPSYLFLCAAAEGEEPAVAQTLRDAIEHEGATLRNLWACLGTYRVVALGLFNDPGQQAAVVDAVKDKHGVTGSWLEVKAVPTGDEIDGGHWKGGLGSGSI